MTVNESYTLKKRDEKALFTEKIEGKEGGGN